MWWNLSNPGAIWCLQQVILDKTCPNTNLWARICPKIGAILYQYIGICGFILLGFFSRFLKHFLPKPKNRQLDGFVIYSCSLFSKDHMYLTAIEWKRTRSMPRVNYKIKNSMAILNHISSGYKTKPTSVYVMSLTDSDSSSWAES